MSLELDSNTLAQLDRLATEAWPSECCGAVLRIGSVEEVRPIENVQDRMHAEAPEDYPRDSKTAYFMEPKALLEALRAADAPGASLAVFYHSHPEHDAYFSAEDKARAMAWDEPAYPDTTYVVISVYDRVVRDRRAYAWSDEAGDFVEVELIPA